MKMLYAAVAAVALTPVAAMAGGSNSTASGTAANGMSWTASSTIVGQTSTGTVASGGSPTYLAPNTSGYSGVVGILTTYSNGSQYVCSGSLMTSGKILTAAHCVSDGYNRGQAGGVANGLIRTQVLFQNDASSAADAAIYGLPAGVTAIDVNGYNVHIGYTGEVIDQNDIALLSLSSAAPSFAQAYDIYTGGDLTGELFNVTGYGTRSIVGGAEGTTGPGEGAGSGRRRQGYNIYDYALGDDRFDGFFTDVVDGTNFFGTTAKVDYSYISDFDNGRVNNSQSCLIAYADTGTVDNTLCFGAGASGLGAFEVSIAGGDSGGGSFIDGKIASVNSYSLSFGTGYGDYKAGLQSSWGELNGFVPTFIHADFINGVPEPSTWAMLILGFGVVGGAMRRRGTAQVRFA